jgi:hypothetical protein
MPDLVEHDMLLFLEYAPSLQMSSRGALLRDAAIQNNRCMNKRPWIAAPPFRRLAITLFFAHAYALS